MRHPEPRKTHHLDSKACKPDRTAAKVFLFFTCVHLAEHTDVIRSKTWERGDWINPPSNALAGLIRFLLLLPIKLDNNTSRPSCGRDAPACFNYFCKGKPGLK